MLTKVVWLFIVHSFPRCTWNCLLSIFWSVCDQIMTIIPVIMNMLTHSVKINSGGMRSERVCKMCCSITVPVILLSALLTLFNFLVLFVFSPRIPAMTSTLTESSNGGSAISTSMCCSWLLLYIGVLVCTTVRACLAFSTRIVIPSWCWSTHCEDILFIFFPA